MRFVFVDEISTNLPHYRRYGRATQGRRVDQHGGPNVTLLAALTTDELC